MNHTLRFIIVARFKASGLTQRALSKLSGVHTTQISRYLTGTRDLHGASIDRLLAALHVDLALHKEKP